MNCMNSISYASSLFGAFLGGGGDGSGGGGSSKIIDIRMQEVSGIYVYKHNAVQMAWIIELCVDWTINSWKRTR